MATSNTPSEKLLELVGRLYYLENRSQSQIGHEERVLQLYYSAEPRGRKRAKTNTGKRMPLSQATVNRLLQRAKQLGVVSVSIDSSFAVEMALDQDLSRELRDAFLLQECSVLRPRIDLSPAASENGPPDGDDRNPESEWSFDETETEERTLLGLSNFAAAEARNTWQSGDHTLLGGGRTTCWFARAMKRNPPSKRDLAFTPLSGRLWVEDWRFGEADIMEKPLDADDAVHILAEAFENEPGGRFSQINQPLYLNSVTEAELILKRHCALGPRGQWNFDLPAATRAYVGIGSLASDKHRLAIFLEKYKKGDPTAKSSYLAAAAKDLLCITGKCENNQLEMPADIGNRIFPALMLPSKLIGLRSLEDVPLGMADVSAKIALLNSKAIVMDWLHLRRTRSVRAIASGGSKLPGLWTILLAARADAARSRRSRQDAADKTVSTPDKAPLISELTTDCATAQALLSAIEMVKNDEALSRWYERVLPITGLTAKD